MYFLEKSTVAWCCSCLCLFSNIFNVLSFLQSCSHMCGDMERKARSNSPLTDLREEFKKLVVKRAQDPDVGEHIQVRSHTIHL